MKKLIVYMFFAVIIFTGCSGMNRESEKKVEKKTNELPFMSELGENGKTDNQSIVVSDLKITLRKYVYSSKLKSGVCIFSVKSTKNRKLENSNTDNIEGDLNVMYGEASSREIKKKSINNTLWIQLKFISEATGKSNYSDKVLLCRTTQAVGEYHLEDCDNNGFIFRNDIKVSSMGISIPQRLQCKNLDVLLEDGEEIHILKDSSCMTLANETSEKRRIFWFDKVCGKKIKGISVDGKNYEISIDGK